MFDLTGKTAVVTGGGKGIGEAICRMFAAHGAAVSILDIDPASADQVCTDLRKDGHDVEVFPCDVGNQEAVSDAMALTYDRFRSLDILVNNAGIAHIGTAENTTEADMDRVFRVNVKGVHHPIRTAIPFMRAGGGGSIINVASIASVVGLSQRFAYTMSKGAVIAMTRSVAMDYIDASIRCNCVLPARVHTPFVDGYLREHYPGQEREMFDRLSKSQPIGRMGRPEEVATLILYLASDASAFLTGAALPIDGGVLSLHP